MQFKVGDTVRLKESSLANPELVPTKFVKSGFQNLFTVARTETVVDIDTSVEIDAITLGECCEKIVNALTGKPFCNSHPESLFELVVEEKKAATVGGAKPERETTIDTPLGRLLQLGLYKLDNGNAAVRLTLPFGLDPIEVTGPWATMIGDRLKELKAL